MFDTPVIAHHDPIEGMKAGNEERGVSLFDSDESQHPGNQL